MPTDTAEMKDTAQQGTGTATATAPEHHQTQAAAGSPQAGGAPASNASRSRTAPGAGVGATSGSTGTSMSSGAQGSTGMSGSAPQTGMSRRRGSYMSPMSLLPDPFGMMRSMMDQMDRLFGDFPGFGGLTRPQGGSSPLRSTGGGYGTTSLWYPQIEVSEREGNLVVCADLPGMKKEDVHLEVHDDYLVLEGERRNEQSQNQEGVYRSERSYGSFYRTVPLPDGVNPDQVKANFKDGVLEVTIPMPNRQQQTQGRKIEIT